MIRSFDADIMVFHKGVIMYGVLLSLMRGLKLSPTAK